MRSKTAIAIFILCLACLVCGCRRKDGPSRSQNEEKAYVDDIGFELKYTFNPTQKAYDGIPIEAFRADWEAFEVMTYETMPARLAALVKGNGLAVQVDKDLDKDGVAERFICGVYRDKNQSSGDFIAVLKGSKVEFVTTWGKSARLPHMKEFEDGVFFGNGFGSEYFAYLAFEAGAYIKKDAHEE